MCRTNKSRLSGENVTHHLQQVCERCRWIRAAPDQRGFGTSRTRRSAGGPRRRFDVAASRGPRRSIRRSGGDEVDDVVAVNGCLRHARTEVGGGAQGVDRLQEHRPSRDAQHERFAFNSATWILRRRSSAWPRGNTATNFSSRSTKLSRSEEGWTPDEADIQAALADRLRHLHAGRVVKVPGYRDSPSGSGSGQAAEFRRW